MVMVGIYMLAEYCCVKDRIDSSVVYSRLSFSLHTLTPTEGENLLTGAGRATIRDSMYLFTSPLH